MPPAAVQAAATPPPPFVRPLLAVPPKLFTLALVHDAPNARLLLGRKKTGFGANYYNGFGGKVEAGETIVQAAHRELHEEAGISAQDMQPRGVLTFAFDDQPLPWEVHVFCVTRWTGEPRESEEMAPVWTPVDAIPYCQMWADDEHWYPLFLEGACFKGLFAFAQTHTLVWHRLVEVGGLEDDDAAGPSATELLAHAEGAA